MQTVAKIEDVVIVGGGDAGKLAALIFKQSNPSLSVSVIDDSSEPPRKVGKSTFSSITWILHDRLEIDTMEFIREVNPVWKHSVWLEDWTGAEFFTPFDLKHLMDKSDSPLENVHLRYRSGNFSSINELATYHNKTPYIEVDGVGRHQYYPYVAYHLNVHKFNNYLHELMNRRNIDVFDERIDAVHTDGDQITSIESKCATHEADLYVDATGFQRVLASELPTSFSEYDFSLDSALVTQLPINLEDIVPATVVKTLDNGWTWQIDTTDSRDLGYVFASEYTTSDEAERAFRKQYNIPDDISTSLYEFTSGKFDRPWIGNCLLAGDAFGFVEPLQATSLSTHAHVICDIVDQLTENSWVMHDGVRGIANKIVNTYWREIYNFLTTFYRYSHGETAFWRDMQSVGDNKGWFQYEKEYRAGAAFTISKAKWANEGIAFGKMFNVHQTDYTMYQLGVPIDIHESDNIEVSVEAQAHVKDETESVAETVDAFLTYPELYSSDCFGEPKQLNADDEPGTRNEFET